MRKRVDKEKSIPIIIETEPITVAKSNNKNKRSQSDKIRRLKYNPNLLKKNLAEVEEAKLMLRNIFAGLKDSFNFEQELIERIACEDK